jgi:hypothetical protein
MVKTYWAILIVGFTVFQGFPTTLRAGQASPVSTAGLVAEVRQRVETDRLEVRVYQRKKPVQLAGFMELFVVTPLPGPRKALENLTQKSVAIFRSEKKPDRWEVYQDVWIGTGHEQTLAGNVFKVKQVLISSARSPVELRLDGQTIRLEPGDALLVL